MTNVQQMHPASSGAYGAVPPGDEREDVMAGSGIKLTGLLCPQCRLMCHGVNALKEHMAAAHGILNTAPAPIQAPSKGQRPAKGTKEAAPVNRVWTSTPNVHAGQDFDQTSCNTLWRDGFRVRGDVLLLW